MRDFMGMFSKRKNVGPKGLTKHLIGDATRYADHAVALSGVSAKEPHGYAHDAGTDAARYAGYIQHARDVKDFDLADYWRDFAESVGFKVMQTPGRTELTMLPPHMRMGILKERSVSAPTVANPYAIFSA